MCRGCFSKLVLHDDLHQGGITRVLDGAARLPSRSAFMATTADTAPDRAADAADLILRGGTIRPLPGAPVASALAIKGGKVLAVGDESALSALKTGGTKVIDLAGRTLLPGSSIRTATRSSPR